MEPAGARPPRVLFLAESYHPILGGGETHLRDVAGGLAAAGWQTTVVTRRAEPDWPGCEWLDGVEVRRVPPAGPGRSGKYLMLPSAFAAVVRLARRHDVVVVRGTRVLGLPGVVAARLVGAAVVLQPEINGELDGQAYTWGRAWGAGRTGALVRAAVRPRLAWLREADAFVAMSRAIRDEMLAAGVEPGRIHLLPHGVDVDRFRPGTPDERAAERRRLGLPPEGTVVAYVGRLLAGKGLESLLDAFEGLVAGHPDARLLLVGSGEGQSLSVESELRRRAADRALAGRVVLSGRLDDVAGALRAADVFAFPSAFEALGLALIEAAATGLACVATRTGGIVDVIDDGVSGLLVEAGHTAGLRDALARLAADRELRVRLGGHARRAVEARFDRRGSLRRYRCLFAELTRSRSSACSPAHAPRAGAATRRSPAPRA